MSETPSDNPQPGAAPPSRRKGAIVVAAVAAVIAVLLAAFQGVGADHSGESAAPDPAAAQSDGESAPVENGEEAQPSQDEVIDALAELARREPGDPTAMGDVDAPVVMVVYSDFQCPFCGRHATETEPELIERYVEHGTMRLEWRDLPYLGEESDLAALAGKAAARQDMFWEFNRLMFEDQTSTNSGELTVDSLADRAEQVGMDRERFVQDMASDEVAAEVTAETMEGQSIGITGTPAFLINGRPIIGAQPLETFTDMIDQIIAEDAGDAAEGTD